MSSITAQPLPAPTPQSPIDMAQVPRSWIGRVMLQTVGRTGAKIGLVWIGLIVFFAVFAPLLANSHPIAIKIDGQWSSPLVQHLTGVDISLMTLFFAAVIVMPLRRFRVSARFAMVLWILAVVLPLTLWPAMTSWVRERLWLIEQGRGWLPYLQISLVVIAAAVDLLLVFWLMWRMRVSVTTRAVLFTIAGLMAIVFIHPNLHRVEPPRLPKYAQWRDLERVGRVDAVVRTPLPYSPTDRLSDKFDINNPHPWAPSWAYHIGADWRGDLPRPNLFEHPLGTDRNAQDILSQIIHASRIAMSIGFIATGIAVVIGVIVGGLMGYFAGWVDLFGMRLVEIFGSIPTLYLLLAFVAFFGRDIYLMMVIIGIVSWTGDARFVRAEFLKLRKQDFVQAAVASGLRLRSVLFRHILPNALAPLLVSASFGVASAIIAESTLSFLGLGLIDEASWGALLNQALSAGGRFNWWIAVFPGLMIFLTVFSYNLIGEALRDALDPRLKKN